MARLKGKPAIVLKYKIICIKETSLWRKVHVAIGQIGSRLMELMKTTKDANKSVASLSVTSSVCEWNSRKVAWKWANGFAGSKPRLQTCIYYTTPRRGCGARERRLYNGEPGTPRSCCFLVSRWQCHVANLHPTTAFVNFCPPCSRDFLLFFFFFFYLKKDRGNEQSTTNQPLWNFARQRR